MVCRCGFVRGRRHLEDGETPFGHDLLVVVDGRGVSAYCLGVSSREAVAFGKSYVVGP